MIRKYLVPIPAIAGAAIGVIAVKRSTHHYRSVPPAVQPAGNPYTNAIAASGIIEPESRSIAVSPFISGVVTHVFVVWNQRVVKGQKLFQLDTRQAKAQVALARAGVLTAQAELAEAKANLAKLQFADTAAIENITDNPQLAALILGDIRHLNVRLQIDQEDASRFNPAEAAMCFVRGMTRQQIPLTFLRIEPFVVPKQNLTGAPTEQVETRVLQVVYRMGSAPFPLYVGQQVDAFIKAGKSALRAKP